MNLLSWILLGAILFWLGYAIFRAVRHGGGCSCSGCSCAGCASCAKGKRKMKKKSALR